MHIKSASKHSVVGGFAQSHIIILLNQNDISVIILGNPVPENEENAKLCLCPTCPTFKQSNLSSIVFCARGKAKETVKAVGCFCPNCAVFAKYMLDQMYYCVHGKSADIKA